MVYDSFLKIWTSTFFRILTKLFVRKFVFMALYFGEPALFKVIVFSIELLGLKKYKLGMEQIKNLKIEKEF